MKTAVIISTALFLLAGLLFFEKREKLKGILLTKPILSGLFVLCALLQYQTLSIYFLFITAGLLFCMAGDICLAFFFNRKIFTLGLVFFLSGHILYVIAFLCTGHSGSGTWISIPVLAVLSILIFRWLKPHLGSMKVPVTAYIAIISTMVIGGTTIGFTPSFTPAARSTIMTGVILFYCSDIFVARHRFIEKNMINRYLGLPMYNSAQFLLALSIGMIG